VTAALQDFSREVDFLIRAGVVVLFLLIPIARGVMEARRKQAERESQKRASHPTGEPAERTSGKQLWEQLLRGEAPPESPWPPPQAPPKPRRAATAAAPAPKRPAHPPPRPSPPARPAPRAAPAASASLEAPSREHAQAAAAQWNAPEGLEQVHRAPVGTVAPASLARQPTMASLGGVAMAAAELRRPGELARAAEWRRAVVFAELLAPPLALRSALAWPGPPLAG
jgi:hypothetical protein